MKTSTKDRTTSAGIQAEMQTLESRRFDIERRRAETVTALDEAKAQRSDALAIEGSDVDAISKSIRAHTLELEDLSLLLDDIKARAEDAARRHATALDLETRASQAERLEAIATAVDSKTPDLVKAVIAVAKAVQAMIAEIPADVGLFATGTASRPDDSSGYAPEFASRTEAVAAVLANALAGAAPSLFKTSSEKHGYRSGLYRVLGEKGLRLDWCSHEFPGKPAAISEVVDSLISSQLRSRAILIADGDAQPFTGHVEPDEPLSSSILVIKEVEVFALREFSFVANELGRLSCIGANWVANVPEPVASLAVSRGLALRTDTTQGAAALETEKTRRKQPLASRVHSATRPQDCVALGDVMGFRSDVKRASDVKLDDEFEVENV